MSSADLKTAYELAAELLLSPDDRDAAKITRLNDEHAHSLPEVAAQISTFLASPDSDSVDEYTETLELAPSCPLYLGAHLFDEPSTCNGIGSSGRNPYMLEMLGIYEHFGLDLAGRELPDFLPVMVEFLAISLDAQVRDQVGLRRWFLEHHLQPGLGPLSDSLGKFESPYLHVIAALREAMAEDLRRMGDAPAWQPPDAPAKSVSLPVLGSNDSPRRGGARTTVMERCP